MTTIYPIRYRRCDGDDRSAVSAFLYQTRHQVQLLDRQTADEIGQQLLTTGDVIGGFHEGQLIGLIAYQLNDNDAPRAQETTTLISTVGLAQRYRTTSIFQTGLKHLVDNLSEKGIQQLQFYAPEQSSWLNQLYAAVATPMGTALNDRGVCCVVYRASVEDVRAALKKKNVQSLAYVPGHESMIAGMMQQGF